MRCYVPMIKQLSSYGSEGNCFKDNKPNEEEYVVTLGDDTPTNWCILASGNEDALQIFMNDLKKDGFTVYEDVECKGNIVLSQDDVAFVSLRGLFMKEISWEYYSWLEEDFSLSCVKPVNPVATYKGIFVDYDNALECIKQAIYKERFLQKYQEDTAEYMEENTIPDDNELFVVMRKALSKAIKGYAEKKDNSFITEFADNLASDLSRFGDGDGHVTTYAFSISYHSDPRNMFYLSFNMGDGSVEISRGGVEYTEGVGSDSYTSWTIFFHADGTTENLDNFEAEDFDMFEELLSEENVKLSIELPEEF